MKNGMEILWEVDAYFQSTEYLFSQGMNKLVWFIGILLEFHSNFSCVNDLRMSLVISWTVGWCACVTHRVDADDFPDLLTSRRSDFDLFSPTFCKILKSTNWNTFFLAIYTMKFTWTSSFCGSLSAYHDKSTQFRIKWGWFLYKFYYLVNFCHSRFTTI